MANHPQIDSLHIALLFEYGKTFMGVSSDSTLVYGKEVLRLAELISNPRLQVGGYSMMGASYSMKNEDIDQAAACFFKAVEITRKHQGPAWRTLEARMLINLGGIKIILKQYNAGFEYYRQAAPILEESKDTVRIADCYQAWGMVYEGAGKLDSAVICFKHALALHERINNQQGVVNLRLSLGDVYNDRKQYREAESAYLYGLVHMDSVAQPRDYAELLVRLGLNYT
jgi:tetratricopeptide (TPR) repeat protein